MFFSCQKEAEINSSVDAISDDSVDERRSAEIGIVSVERPETKAAECRYGSFSIVDGMIRFDNFDSFLQTIDFLGCASQADIEDWENQVQILTVSKQFNQFLSRLTDDMSNEEIDNILLDYKGQISKRDSEDGYFIFEPKYFSHNYFRNTEGLFLIENRIVAEHKHTRISILDGDWSILEDIKNDPLFPENHEEYIDFDNVLVERHDYTAISCCDNFNDGQHFYDGNDKRINVSYRWEDVSEMRFVPNVGFFFHPIVSWSMSAKSERRRNPSLLGWRDHQRHWSFNLDVVYAVSPGSPDFEAISDTYGVRNDAWTSSVSGDLTPTRLTPRGPYAVPRGGFVCAFDINFDYNLHEILNGPIDESTSLSCTPTIDPCDECPPGWNLNRGSCYSGICAPNAFVFGNQMWYPAVNGQCNSGGAYNSGADACYLGYFPGVFGDPFVWNNCFWIGAGCPWDQ